MIVLKMMNKIQEIKKIIDERVRGKIVEAHDVFGHHYKFVDTGNVYDSVTTKDVMAKPHIVPWAVRLGIEKFIALMEAKNWDKTAAQDKMLQESCILAWKDVRDEAGTVGTGGHGVIEIYANKWIETGKRPEDIREFIPEGSDARVWAVARSAEAFFKKNNVEPIASDLLIGVEKYKSAGTLDSLIYNFDTDQIEILDYKSSNSISQESYSIQVAAYVKFFEIMTGLKIGKVRVLKLSKDYDKCDIYILKNIASAFKAFKANSFIYDWRSNHKDKLVKNKKIIKI